LPKMRKSTFYARSIFVSVSKWLCDSQEGLKCLMRGQRPCTQAWVILVIYRAPSCKAQCTKPCWTLDPHCPSLLK
jgi:hypothetical protein